MGTVPTIEPKAVRKIVPAAPARSNGRALAPVGRFEVETLRALLTILEPTDITRLDWRKGDERISLRRESGRLGSGASERRSLASFARTPPAGEGAPEAQSDASVHLVTSPFVGTFYWAPSPDAPPFVEAGQSVRKGQVLCIVEAMKLMNEIESEADGRVAEVFVQNAQPVEFGQALFRIELAG